MNGKLQSATSDLRYMYHTDLVPYVFQLMAYLLELRGNSIQKVYVDLFQPLLAPALWSRRSYRPPLVRLLQAYLTNAPQVKAT